MDGCKLFFCGLRLLRVFISFLKDLESYREVFILKIMEKEEER